MSTIRAITKGPNLTSTQLANADRIKVVDASTGKTKEMLVSDLVTALLTLLNTSIETPELTADQITVDALVAGATFPTSDQNDGETIFSNGGVLTVSSVT